jgi:hypothetical protein
MRGLLSTGICTVPETRSGPPTSRFLRCGLESPDRLRLKRGLDPAGLCRGPGTHRSGAIVEACREKDARSPLPPNDEPNQDFDSLDGDPAEALQVWRAECDRSRRIVEEASGLDQEGEVERNGSYTLRWLMLRMIGEHAQHAGHADLLREGIDGATGA